MFTLLGLPITDGDGVEVIPIVIADDDLLENIIDLAVEIEKWSVGSVHRTRDIGLRSSDMIRQELLKSIAKVVVYLLLRKYNFNSSLASEMTAGFWMTSSSMVYAAVLQHYINISATNSIHVWIQAPAYVFVALSEAFVIITGSG